MLRNRALPAAKRDGNLPIRNYNLNPDNEEAMARRISQPQGSRHRECVKTGKHRSNASVSKGKSHNTSKLFTQPPPLSGMSWMEASGKKPTPMGMCPIFVLANIFTRILPLATTTAKPRQGRFKRVHVSVYQCGIPSRSAEDLIAANPMLCMIQKAFWATFLTSIKQNMTCASVYD